MKDTRGNLCLSATDLANHLACNHLTSLEQHAVRGKLVRPQWEDPALEALLLRGRRFEHSFVEHLRHEGLSTTALHEENGRRAVDRTIDAMRTGVDVIVQGALEHGRWHGRADVLGRVDAPSELGPWSYEVYDTKLARRTRAGSVLQLCLYSELLQRAQGVLPAQMHVVSPGEPFREETLKVSHYMAYFRLVRTQLEAAVDQAPQLPTYPEPCPHCEVCRWWALCNDRRRRDDHLSLVAGISRQQRREVGGWGVRTLEGLGELALPLKQKPKRGAAAGYERVCRQARIQLAGRRSGEPVHELLAPAAGRGLALLPPPDPGDVFFDIEGDAFVGTQGLEYLFGWAIRNGDAAPRYHRQWALDAASEKGMFEAFLDTVAARRSEHPGMHVYHYSPYEPSALKRLMGRHGTREDLLDRLLRAGVFVDLHAVVRQGLRASVERYSIKELEPFYGFEREMDLREASRILRRVEAALELGDRALVDEPARKAVEAYNRDDCLSALALRDWLEARREELVAGGADVPRPLPGDEHPRAELQERLLAVQALATRLTADVPAEASLRDEEQSARWLLAQLLGYHRRENKVAWWELFRLRALDEDELHGERAAIAGLRFVERVGGTDACPVHRYTYPPQDTELRAGAALRAAGDGTEIGTVEDIDAAKRWLDVRKRSAAADDHPAAVFAHRVVPTRQLEDALLRLAEWVADHGIDAPGPWRAGRDLLLKAPPRIRGEEPMQESDEAPQDAARRLALRLDRTVLPIQGPPGAGKTYTAAQMISDLLAAGKRVGITAVSHKVIRHLIDRSRETALAAGQEIACLQAVREATNAPFREETSTKAACAAIAGGEVQLAGGTAWMWAREEMHQAVDVLFVDEAAQMCLANVIAVSHAADSVVLLGDPQQLEQPQQGSHPDGSELSALDHVLEGAPAIAADRGLFLDQTWRLHPSICGFTSEMFYDGRLESRPELAQQALAGPTPYAGAGLWYVPVRHEGNTSASTEEVDAVERIVSQLLRPGVQWIDAEGAASPLTPEHILIVAPYNAQVSELGERLLGHRIGTVDRFQGQEAPVVIYSLTTSSPLEAPHGMEFLYSLNRLNVATSRARCACFVVGAPALFEPECRTPRQIRLANALCRYRELASRG